MEDRVDLGSQLEAYVDELVEDGRFASREEVLREGVRVLQEREREVWLAELEASIERGVADSEAGRVVDLDAVADRLHEKYRAIAKAQGR